MQHTYVSVRRPLIPVTILMLLALTGGSHAQRDPGLQAVTSCEQELSYQMGNELRGRDPEAQIDTRDLDLRTPGRDTIALQGRGDFRRDRFDRGRPFTFDCRFDTRSGDTRVNYRWSGRPNDDYDDPGYIQPPSYRPRPGNNAPVYPPSGRVFFSGGLLNQASGKALDVEGRSSADGANVQQWGFAGNPNQLWDIIDQGNGEFSIISQNSGKALDVANHNGGDGANVQQYRWHNGDNQRWRLERVGGGFYQIVSVSSGRCLDVEQIRVNQDGANVQQWSCSGRPNQRWRLQPRGR